MLEFTLTQLWEHKRGPEISHAAYQGIGGVAGALSRYAKNVYQDDLLKQFPMERIRRVLLALVRSRGGAADATRRVVSRDRLGADWDIAQALASHRLVTISRDDSKGTETAEIVHEALIREWPTLATWVNNDSSTFQRWLSRQRNEPPSVSCCPTPGSPTPTGGLLTEPRTSRQRSGSSSRTANPNGKDGSLNWRSPATAPRHAASPQPPSSPSPRLKRHSRSRSSWPSKRCGRHR